MKNFALTALVAAWALLGQTPAWGQKFEVLLNDGLNFSTLVGVENASATAGLYSEIALGYHFNDALGLEFGLAWSEQGAMNSIGETFYTYEYDYLNFPLVGTYTLPNQKFTFFAGVQAGCFLIAKYSYESPSLLGDGVVSDDGYLKSGEFRPLDFGATVGMRWLAAPEYDLAIEVRYTRGLTPTHKGVATSTYDDPLVYVPNNRNSVLRIGVSWALWRK